MFHLGRREPSGIFISDDRPALDFARNRGLFALDTSQVLTECFQQGEVRCPEAQTSGSSAENPGMSWGFLIPSAVGKLFKCYRRTVAL